MYLMSETIVSKKSCYCRNYTRFGDVKVGLEIELGLILLFLFGINGVRCGKSPF